ncbi:MAG: 50S ribosomal protein L29 [Gammaproteobacteria bacterium]|nr:50S ribosomal protein L29 [Pseudomonadales bacterium]
MNTSELRGKSVDELQQQLGQLRKDQFSYRMQMNTGQLGQVHLLKAVRRDIARVKTIISEKQKSDS